MQDICMEVDMHEPGRTAAWPLIVGLCDCAMYLEDALEAEGVHPFCNPDEEAAIVGILVARFIRIRRTPGSARILESLGHEGFVDIVIGLLREFLTVCPGRKPIAVMPEPRQQMSLFDDRQPPSPARPTAA